MMDNQEADLRRTITVLEGELRTAREAVVRQRVDPQVNLGLRSVMHEWLSLLFVVLAGLFQGYPKDTYPRPDYRIFMQEGVIALQQKVREITEGKKFVCFGNVRLSSHQYNAGVTPLATLGMFRHYFGYDPSHVLASVGVYQNECLSADIQALVRTTLPAFEQDPMHEQWRQQLGNDYWVDLTWDEQIMLGNIFLDRDMSCHACFFFTTVEQFLSLHPLMLHQIIDSVLYGERTYILIHALFMVDGRPEGGCRICTVNELHASLGNFTAGQFDHFDPTQNAADAIIFAMLVVMWQRVLGYVHAIFGQGRNNANALGFADVVNPLLNHINNNN